MYCYTKKIICIMTSLSLLHTLMFSTMKVYKNAHKYHLVLVVVEYALSVSLVVWYQ